MCCYRYILMFSRVSPPTTLWILLAILVFVRLAAIALFGEGASSQDMGYWVKVATALRDHKNPYVETSYLNWPPLWMLCIWFFDNLAQFFDMPLKVVIKLGLIVGDAAVLFGIHALLNHFKVTTKRKSTLLFGFVLNPVAIILTTVHGNFDVLVAIWCLACVLFTMKHLNTRDAVDRIWAALALGFGILTKTVPLVLFPLLFSGAHSKSKSESLLVSILAIFPAALGLGIIYVLAPAEVNERVIGYRGVPGWYGLSGLFDLVGLEIVARKIYPGIFFLVVLSAIMVLLKRFREEVATKQEEILASSIFLLLLVPTLGPGFGLQYAYWSLPLILVGTRVLHREFLWSAVTYFLLTSIVYTILYGTSPSLGAFGPHVAAYYGFSVSAIFYSKTLSLIITAPIFASALWVLAECCRALAMARSTRTQQKE